MKLMIENVGEIIDRIEIKAVKNKKEIIYIVFVVKKFDKHYGLAPIKALETKKFKGDNTICQTLREIYQLSEDDKIKLLCRRTMMIAKSITKRASAYKKIAKKNGINLMEIKNADEKA